MGTYCHELTSAPPHPHTVKLGAVVFQQLDQVIFVVVELEICLHNKNKSKM